MQFLKKVLLFLVAMALISGMVVSSIYAISSFFSYVSSVPKELGAALIAGASTIIVATVTVMIGRHFERKKELDALYRDKKTEVYDAFLKVFFRVLLSEGKSEQIDTEPDLVQHFRDFSVKLVLWGGPEVLEAFAQWKDTMAAGQLNAKAIFETERFLDAIRIDLRHSNRGVRKGWFARLFLKEGGLFLAMAAKNPNVTLVELAAAEAALQKIKSDRANSSKKNKQSLPT